MRIMKNKIKGLLIIASTAVVPTLSVCAEESEKDKISETIVKITNLLTTIGGVLAILGFVVAGLMMTLAYENEENVKNAKNIIKWSMIGLLVILMAKALSAIVEGVVVK